MSSVIIKIVKTAEIIVEDNTLFSALFLDINDLVSRRINETAWEVATITDANANKNTVMIQESENVEW